MSCTSRPEFRWRTCCASPPSTHPLEDIRAQRKVLRVMKGDRLYDPATIYRGLSIKPFTTSRAASAGDPRR